MSWKTNFIRTEIALWRKRIHQAWRDFRFRYAVRPLRYRTREFANKYLFFGIRARWRRERQAVANANAFQARISERQRRCSHLKGQRYWNMTGAPQPPAHRDYNVSFHRFVNNRARVICNICHRRWWEGDVDWDKALDMVKNSTNKASSSEIPAAVLRGEFPWRQPAPEPLFGTRIREVIRVIRDWWIR